MKEGRKKEKEEKKEKEKKKIEILGSPVVS